VGQVLKETAAQFANLWRLGGMLPLEILKN